MANYSKFLSIINGADRTVDLSLASNILELGGGGLQMDGSTSGHVVISASATTTTYSIVWPAAQAASSGYTLSNDGTGVLTWVPSASGAVTSISVNSANGFAGTSSGGSTPALTLSTTITGILKGNGTAISAATAGTDYVIPSGSITGTAGNVTATSNSTLTTLSALSLPGSQVTGNISGSAGSVSGTNVITNSNLAQMPTLTIKGNNTGGTANAADLTVAQVNAILPIFTSSLNGLTPASGGGTTNFLRADGTWAVAGTGTVTSVTFTGDGTVLSSTPSSAVTTSGTLTATLNTQSANTVLAGPTTGSAASPTFRALVLNDIPSLSSVYLPLAGGTMSGSINMGSNSITSLATPVNPNDAVNKSYVDNFINATSWKTAALVATTANITLSGEQTIDGVLTSSSRVLVKNQSAPANNGIYTSGSGAWTRTSDMSTWAEVPAAAIFIESGTANADLGFVCTSQPGGTLGTTAITFVQFSSAGAYAADNVTLQLVSGVFSIKNAGVTQTQIASSSFSASGAISGGSGTAISVNVDNSTIDINGSNNLEVKSAGITSTQLASASVTAAKLGSVTDGVTLDQSGAGSTIEIKTAGVGTTQLASAAVTAAKLGTVTDGVTLDQSGSGATIEIKTSGVGTAQIAASAVTAAKLGSVTDGVTLDQAGAGSTIEVKTGGIGTTQLASAAVTAAKLGAVTDGITTDQNGAGSTIEVLNAPSLKRSLVAGQSFTANTSYAVRWGITANGETAGRVYAADITTSSFDLFYVIGMASSAAGVTAGQNITVTSMGAFALSSSDTAFASSTDGDAVFLTASGTFSVTAPSSAGQAVTRIGIVQIRSATVTSNIIDVWPQVVGVN